MSSSPARASSRPAIRWRRPNPSGCGCGTSRSASTRSTRRAPTRRSRSTNCGALADAHDITRLAIETRKDQLEKLDWTIKPRGDTAAPATRHARASARVAEFWRRPDGERPFATWLRELLEDLLVLDAPALEVRRNRGGELDRPRCRRRRHDQGAGRRDRPPAAAAGAGLRAGDPRPAVEAADRATSCSTCRATRGRTRPTASARSSRS